MTNHINTTVIASARTTTRWPSVPAGVIPALLAMTATAAFSLPSARASSMMLQDPEPDKPFVLVDLGVPPGYTDCTVNGISADGRFITGQCSDGQQVAAFVWDRDLFLAEFVDPGPPSPWIILDTQALPGGVGLSVNEAGQVAGTFIFSGTQHGFIWCPPVGQGDPTIIDTGVGQASDIGEEDNGLPAVAYAAGWTVGQDETFGWQVDGCSLTPLILPFPTPADAARPFGISMTDATIAGRVFYATTADHAALWLPNGMGGYPLKDLTPVPGTNDHQANAVTNLNLVNNQRTAVGWRGTQGMPDTALRWDRDSLGNWTELVIPGMKEALDINNHEEILAVDAANEYYIVHDTGPNPMSIALADYTLLPRGIDSIVSVAAINDRGFIAATALSFDTGDTHAAIIIPRDDDNNGVPDIRDIVFDLSGLLDENGDWVLDSTLEMRVGLFGPGGKTKQIDNVQVVRLMRYEPSVLHCLVNADIKPGVDCTGVDCRALARQFTSWGYDHSVEIIIDFRTVDPDPPGDNPNFFFDYLPHADALLNSPQILRDIRLFNYRFANCIDGFQVGNEIFTGPGRYYFHEGDLPGGYVGDIKGITSENTLNEAIEAMFGQLGIQLEAARMGSALAGRPLRMIGPAVVAEMTRLAFCNQTPGEQRAAKGVIANVNFANDYSAIFDQHTYFRGADEFEETINKIMDNCPNGCGGTCPTKTQAPWPVPLRIACLEFGPKANDGWWEANKVAVKDFFKLNPNCTVGDEWTVLVNDWKNLEPGEAGGFGGSFELGRLLDKLDVAGFRYACINAMQLGLQGGEFAKPTDMGSLRANLVDPGCVPDPDQFMPIMGDYEAAAADFMIDPFVPHPNPCDCATVCPSGGRGQGLHDWMTPPPAGRGPG